MKNNIFKQSYSLFAVFLFAGMLFTACGDDDVRVAPINEDDYVTGKEAVGYIINEKGAQFATSTDFRNTGTTNLYLGLSKDAPQAASAVLKYDKAVLDAYNKENESNYALFPENLVTFDNNGTASFAVGANKSNAVSVTYATDTALKPNVSYVIPIKAEAKSGDIILSNDKSSHMIFVKDISTMPDCDKSTGIKIISCMEINDTNPLNNLCFTLQDSKKMFVDVLILFSANINYDAELGKVFIYQNPNVQHLLSNHEKYLKPLQDRGIKVVLGILGNHDRSGVANLSEPAAKQFAQELKATCDAYNLDGVFYDDEYSAYQNPPPPGFVTPSRDASARICYESKRAMPDKLVMVYVYGRTDRFINPVDGATAGEYVDYGIHDYGNGSDLSSNYPGLPRSGMGLYSQELNRGYYVSETNLRALRNGGYGAHMLFAMDPTRANFANQKAAMEKTARIFYDEELVYDGKPFAKDW